VAGSQPSPRLSLDALILSHNRQESLRIVLGRLTELSLDEVIVADNGSQDGTAELVRNWGGNVRLLDAGGNVGVAARNLAARESRADLLLMLDDDSYPRDGTLEFLHGAFERQPDLGVAGGRIVDVDTAGVQRRDGFEVGSFDWFLRPRGAMGAPAEGFPASFFPQGGCMVRRNAFLGVGGCFEPYFFYGEEVDLTARMVAAGWEVRYFPQAEFEHRRDPVQGTTPAAKRMLRYRIRNQVWYFWLRAPAWVAAVRIPAYLAYDFFDCLARGTPKTWFGGVRGAWRERALVAGHRRPLSRTALRRAEMDRGRKHVRLLAHRVTRRLLRRG
jgi:GT2 family glycosyltransferase